MAGNRAEPIAEIQGHAARQAADRQDLLAIQRGLLFGHRLGHIAAQEHRAREIVRMVQDGGDRAVDESPSAAL